LVAIGFGNTFISLMFGASLYGIGTGILSPAVNAWTIDLSHPEQRGRAMASMYIALEAGIGLGALFAGFYYQDIAARIPQVMFINSGILLITFLYTLNWQRKNKKLTV